MTRFDDLDRALTAYLDAEAAAAAPAGLLPAALARTSARRPRPAWRARIHAPRAAFAAGGEVRVLAIAIALVALLAALAGLAMLGAGGEGPDPGPLVVAPSPTGRASAAPAASSAGLADGEPWIVYMSQIGEANTDRLWLVRPDGSGRHQLETGLDGQQEHPDWSPDGTRIAFDHWFPDPDVPGRDRVDIWIVDADGTDARRVAACEAPCFQLAYPSWSPDGTRLAVSRFDEQVGPTWGPSAVEVIDAASGERRTVYESPDGSTAIYGPRWSPDGTQLVFELQTFTDATETELLATRLAVVRADGADTAPRIITPPDLVAAEPDWNPVDGRIAFRTHFDPADAVGRDRPTELYSVQPDGTALRPITGFGLGDQRGIQPTWTPDGRSIVFTLVDGFGAAQLPAIALVADDGSGVQRLGFADGTAGRLRPTP